MKNRITAAALLVVAALPARLRADFVLVDKEAGIQPAPLVLFPKAPPLTRVAAVDLADSIEKIGGSRPDLIETTPQQLPSRAIWIGYQPALDSLDVHPGHAFKDWWDRFRKTHPEYFALQPAGTRSGYPSPKHAKLCVSNPDVWKQWLADVEAHIRHNSNLTVFSTAPNDGYGSGHCVCEKCKVWDHPKADLRPFVGLARPRERPRCQIAT
ncbi:MAG: DUF4838 domain-containing protein [Planctomycetota bacterium]|jgi:hypothetical protein|nr:DUF4838 domain-containing protein [Planctomycetota bacterium]